MSLWLFHGDPAVGRALHWLRAQSEFYDLISVEKRKPLTFKTKNEGYPRLTDKKI